MRATVFQLDRAEHELLESLAEFFAASGTGRASARARLRYQVTQWRATRRSFYGSN
jgi:hypothetical protein